jgi:hypothetical protein
VSYTGEGEKQHEYKRRRHFCGVATNFGHRRSSGVRQAEDHDGRAKDKPIARGKGLVDDQNFTLALLTPR